MKKSSFLWWAAPGLFLPFLWTLFLGAIFTGLIRHVTMAHLARMDAIRWVPTASGAVLVLAMIVSLYLLCRAAWPSFRRGWRAWLLLPAMVLAGVMTWLWPFALFAPASRRLGGRRVCACAVAAGLVLLAMYAGLLVMVDRELSFILDAPFRPWNASPLPVFLWWFNQVCAPVGVLLVYAALCGFREKPRAFARVWGALLMLLLAAAVATQPAFRIPSLRRERADRFARLLEASGSALRPGDPLHAATPPVAPADDPIAALDDDAWAKQGNDLWHLVLDFHALRAKPDPNIRSANRPNVRLHPLSEPEAERLEKQLADSPELVAAAEAFSTPGYRSSRPGSTRVGEPAEDGVWVLEPEIERAYTGLEVLAFRSTLAWFHDDPAAALADLGRLRRAAAVYAREPSAFGAQQAWMAWERAWEAGALQARLDLWPTDALEAAVRDADALAGDFETLWSDTLAADLAFAFRDGADAESGDGDWLDLLHKALAFLPPSYHAFWRESDKVAWLRHAETYPAEARAMLALPPGPERAAALRTLRDHLRDTQEKLPLGAVLFGDLSLPYRRHLEMLTWPRDHASVLRTAVAVERYRRDRGTLPPDLDALVPDYLPAVPVGAASGKPIAYTPGPIDLPEESAPSSSRDAPSPEPAEPPFVLPAETLPGFLLDLPGFAPTPLFFPAPGI